MFVSYHLLRHKEKKTIIALFPDESVFFLLLLLFFSLLWFFADDIVLWHDPLCMWVYSYAFACVSCSVVRYIICITLWWIIIKQKEAYSIYFALAKERTQRKTREKKERIGKRDIVVNNIDIERQEKERTIVAQYIHIHTYASQFLSFSTSLFLYSLLPSLSI